MVYRNWPRGLYFCMLLAFLTGCWPQEQQSPVIGVVLAKTGNSDFIGKPEAEVLDALLADYNKKDQNPLGITLSILDSGGDPSTAVTHFNRLTSNSRVIAVIGPSTSGESIAVAKQAEAARTPLLSLAASRKIVTEDDGRVRRWVFKFAQNDDLAATRLLRAMADKKDKRIALLYEDNGFGKSGAEVFKKAVTENPTVTLVHEANFPTALDSPEPFVAAIPKDVNGVLVWGTAPGPALIVKALHSHGYSGTIYLSHGDASEDFITSAGSAAEGAIVVGSRVLMDKSSLNASDPADAVIIRFRDFWLHHFKASPSHFGGHARDAFEAIKGVLSQDIIGKDGNIEHARERLRDAIEKLNQFHGVTGTFTFNESDHAGLTESAFQTYRIEAGRFVVNSAQKNE